METAQQVTLIQLMTSANRPKLSLPSGQVTIYEEAAQGIACHASPARCLRVARHAGRKRFASGVGKSNEQQGTDSMTMYRQNEPRGEGKRWPKMDAREMLTRALNRTYACNFGLDIRQVYRQLPDGASLLVFPFETIEP